MGKVIPFVKPSKIVENQPADLTKAELEACEIARGIKEVFFKDRDAIIAELELEGVDES